MLINGGKFKDERGALSYVNDFTFSGIRRFYHITHNDTSVLRAWQGHRTESKAFFVTQGAFLIGKVAPDNWQQPSTELEVERVTLRASEPAILIIPPGFANGFRALEPASSMIVFSNLGVDESAADLHRFDKDLWKL